MSHAYPNLFAPLKVGPIEVENRICETTNTIGAGGNQGLLDDAFIAHHLAKAAGGTSWIGHETWLLNSPLPHHAADEYHPGAGAIRIPIYLLPGFVDLVKRFADAIHDAGSVVVCQLTHLNNTMAASSVPVVEAYDWIPHALEEAEIHAILDTYAAAAEKFREAGCDGIEIHAAHETTPQTFLSPAMNHRTDAWGGDAERRTRFLREALQRVKDAVGDSMAVGVRLNGRETREGGYDLDELRRMLEFVHAAGTLDFINVDVGHSWGRPPYVASSYYGRAEHRDCGKALKQDMPDVAILFAGRVDHPDLAEELLAGGFCDLVGMTRAGIADPDFPMKAKAGRLDEIRRCIACNRCIGGSVQNSAPDAFKRPKCSVNPKVGQELAWPEDDGPADRAKRLVVVGGGPAGLEAARVAAGRGHAVILLERQEVLGGQFRLSASSPGRESYGEFIAYQERQLAKLGVDVRLATEGSLESVLALEPDAVVCATGSVPIVPRTPGIDAEHVVQGWDVLAGRAKVGRRVAVVSHEDHFQTANVAHKLAEAGHDVEIFHKWTGICGQVDRYSIGPVMQAMALHQIPIHAGLRLAAVEPGKLEFFSSFGGPSRTVEGFDTVALVYGSAPDPQFHAALRDGGKVERVFLVGSAWVPRLLAEAVSHGARVGLGDLKMADLKDYPAIDIMNHMPEIRRDQGGNPFEYKEFQIMLQTTFKAMTKPKKKEPSGDGKKEKKKSGGGMLSGHSSVADCLKDMDELGYTHISVCATKMWSYYYHREFILNYSVEPIAEAVAESGGRIVGTASYDPFRISDSIAEIDRCVKEYGFKYVWFHPLSYGLPPNDRRFYPLYAKCVELDIAVGFQVGHSAEVLPSDCGRPMLADDVAIEFPDLRINLSHTGWPWVDEWCSMLWRHPNVYGDISAYYAKSLDERLIRFMDSSRGRDKVLFGTNGLGLERCKRELVELDIKEETKRKVLYDNSVRFLKLDV